MADMCSPVFILIRFPISRTLACKNSLSKHRPIHNNYSGMVSGISDCICPVEGHWPCNKGVAILSFESLREALMWNDSVPEIRQQDWLEGVDMIIVPCRVRPPAMKRYIQMIDLRVDDVSGYLEQVTSSSDKLLLEMGACGGVVSTSINCITKVRGQWDPHYLVMNFWPSQEAFCKAREASPASRDSCFTSDIRMIAFQLSPLSDVCCNPCST